MPYQAVHVIQLFDREAGSLVPGDREITTPLAARRRAQLLADQHAGTAVISLSQSGAAGSRCATILATFGEVPGAYAESTLRGWSFAPIVRA